ncbi:hypothetical protein TI04_03660 [Achromatium sp. WMS2]|nr:hypothetical protein TI04_03660 [Achromatium sp. WMS2]
MFEDLNVDKPLNLERPKSAREAFVEYSTMECQRRQDSNADFNQQLFDEAVDLIIRKLQRLEDEGRA